MSDNSINTTFRDIGSLRFDNVFKQVAHECALSLRNEVRVELYHLKLRNNQFILGDIEKLLYKNIGYYVFSRMKINKYREDDDEASIVADAVDLVRKKKIVADNAALGELLIYAFLEEKLGAPKIMSKVEAGGNQIHDGLHLLKLRKENGETIFNLVIAKASLDEDFGDAIDAALSEAKTIISEDQYLDDLVDETVLEDKFDKETREFLVSKIVPSATDEPCDYSFGIFIGYEIGLNPGSYSTQEFEEIVEKKMRIDISRYAPYIADKINDSGLSNYSFYFYFVPLIQLEESCRKMLAHLRGE